MLTVSVIVACRNEIQSVAAFLESLDKQERGDFELEAILADGDSCDGTVSALLGFAKTRSWVRILNNPKRIASAGLNLAIRASSGSIIVRMDAHTEYSTNYVKECIRILHETGAASVGGPVRTDPRNYRQRAIAAAYRSRFFSGGSSVYNLQYAGWVDSVPYGCWHRETLEAAGLFDENMIRNQDDELSLRLTLSGGRIWQSPSIRSWYQPRSSWLALAKQFFGYGYWKVYAMRKHRLVVRPRHLAPALAIVLAACLTLNRTAFFCLLLGYAAAVVCCSVLALPGWRDFALLPGIALAFPVAHVSYGTGTLTGVFAFARPW